MGSSSSNSHLLSNPLQAPLALLGGTFDPVHKGHLAVAQSVRQQLALAELRLMPNFSPPHRQPPLLSPPQRLQALRLALADEPGLTLELSEWQAIASGEVSAGYTVDSLARLRALYPRRPLLFVLGADAYADIGSWKKPEQLPLLCHLVVMTRAGVPAAFSGLPQQWLQQYQPQSPLSQDFERQLAGTVRLLQVPEVAVSSTQVRSAWRCGEPLHSLLPAPIIDYLHTLELP